MQNFVALARPADPARPAPAEPRTPTLPTRLARGGAATPVPVDVLVLSSPAPSSSSGLTYQDAAPAAVNRPPQPNPFALAGQAKRAADQALLLAPRPRQPAPGAPAPPPFGLPPSAFSNQPLGASALVPPSRHNSLLSFGSSGAGVGVAPRSTNRQQRELLRTLRSDGGGSSASSATGNGARAGAAGKENVEPARRRPVLAAPRTAGALEPETPKRQRTRVVEWRNDVQRAASVDEGRSSGGVDGAVRVDERVRPRGGAAVGAAGMQAVSKGHGALGAQAQQPRRTAGMREKGEKGEQAGSEDDDERARPAKKVRQRRRAADEPKQRRRSSVSSGAEAAASAPPRRSGRTKRERAPAAAAAAAAGAADETGVSTLDLVAMLPKRAKRFARRGGLSSQDEDEGEDEDEATDYECVSLSLSRGSPLRWTWSVETSVLDIREECA